MTTTGVLKPEKANRKTRSPVKETKLCSRLDRSAKYQLEKDLKEKFEAECIDTSCLLMTHHAINNLQRARDTGAVPPR